MYSFFYLLILFLSAASFSQSFISPCKGEALL